MEENTMSFDEWVAEFGEIPTFEALSKRYPQYGPEDEDEMWARLEQENNESLARAIPGYGYARG